jgi:hypothetical protein
VGDTGTWTKKARKICRRMNRNGSGVNIYRCPVCKYWHIAHHNEFDRSGKKICDRRKENIAGAVG